MHKLRDMLLAGTMVPALLGSGPGFAAAPGADPRWQLAQAQPAPGTEEKKLPHQPAPGAPAQAPRPASAAPPAPRPAPPAAPPVPARPQPPAPAVQPRQPAPAPQLAPVAPRAAAPSAPAKPLPPAAQPAAPRPPAPAAPRPAAPSAPAPAAAPAKPLPPAAQPAPKPVPPPVAAPSAPAAAPVQVPRAPSPLQGAPTARPAAPLAAPPPAPKTPLTAPAQPPAAVQSPAATQPPAASRPLGAPLPAPGRPAAPPVPGQPAAPGQPPAGGQVPAAGQPPAGARVPGNGQPPVAGQPAPAGQPAGSRPLGAPLPTPGAPVAPGQPPAAGQPQVPPVPNAPGAAQQQRKGGGGNAGAIAAGAAAGLVGGFLAGEGLAHLDEVRSRRQEFNQDGYDVIREPGRTILRENGRSYIAHDENERFRDLGYDVRTEHRGDSDIAVYDRPDGTQILTFTDNEGHLLRRTRRFRDGREIVLIDNGPAGVRRYDQDVVVLPPPPIDIPPDRYVVDANQADEGLLYDTLVAPPVAPLRQHYTLDQVRYSPDLRNHMRSIDLDAINFDTGSWTVTPDQASRLTAIAQAIQQAIRRNPQEIFLVEGYTDAVGSDVDNLSLSDRRAQSVAAILTQNFQVPAENLTTQGYGAQYLKVQTQDAARENRRVTIRRITPLLSGQAK